MLKDKKNALKIFLNILFSFMIAVIIPLIASIKLGAFKPSIFILLALIIFTNILFFLKKYSFKTIKIIATIILIIIYCIGSVLIFFYIIIIPYSLYLLWIDLVKLSMPSGSISFLFVIGVGYFSSLFAGLFYHTKIIRPLIGLCFTISFLVTVIYQDFSTFFITSFFFITGIIILSFYSWKDKFKSCISSIRLIIIAFLIAYTFFIFKGENKGWLSYYTLSPSIRNFLEFHFPDLTNIATIPGSGSYFEEKQLGGRALLNKKPVFEVQAQTGENIYLRTQVFDKYNGYNWGISQELLEKAKLARNSYTNFTRNEKTIIIKTIVDYYSFIPHTLDTTSFMIDDRINHEMLFGSIETGFQLKLPIINGTTILLNREKNDVNKIDFSELYLNVPPVISNATIKLAKQLGKNAKSKKEILNNIINYLMENYKYTLTTTYPPDDIDFIDDFLFNQKKGYCVHFTSSFIILTRLNNIPSRYIKGYFVSIPPNINKTICTGFTEHAWAEAWLPESGWITCEATPPMNPNFFNDPFYFSRFNQERDKFIALQLNEIMGIKEKIDERNLKLRFNFKPILLIIAFLLISIISIFIIKKAINNISPYKGNMKKIHSLLKFLLNKFKKIYIPFPDKIGWLAWSNRIKDTGLIKEFYIERSVKIINKTFYSNIKPTNRDVKYLELLKRKLRFKGQF